MKTRIRILVSASILLLACLLFLILQYKKDAGMLTVSFLDIGQGDSILIRSPKGTELLIDGGPDGSVLRELGIVMKLFDRKIDVVLATHPDKDHINGLGDVFNRYEVDYFVHSGVRSNSSLDETLLQIVAIHEVEEILARKGTIIDLGGETTFEVLFPDRDPRGMDTNDASIVGILRYKSICMLFTGDAPEKIERYLIGQYKEKLSCEVLKVGHHGSKTSTSKEFIHFVKPQYAVISAGKDNAYGHPHVDVLSVLNDAGVKILTTQEGRVTLLSDGVSIKQK